MQELCTILLVLPSNNHSQFVPASTTRISEPQTEHLIIIVNRVHQLAPPACRPTIEFASPWADYGRDGHGEDETESDGNWSARRSTEDCLIRSSTCTFISPSRMT